MFITVDELQTHLYQEQIEAISGVDNTIITASIDGAVAEAKGYLHQYDTEAVFNAAGADRNALLVIFVKDIAVWHYINLANPGAELKTRQDRYKSAVAWLKSVQAGEVVPDLPKPSESVSAGYVWGSNKKRDNHI